MADYSESSPLFIRYFPFVFRNVAPTRYDTLLETLLHNSHPIIHNFHLNFKL